MRTKYYLILGITSICCLFLLPACDSSAIPVEPNGCTWINDSISAQFYYAEFYLPDEECKEFETQDLSYYTSGVYNLMHSIDYSGLFTDCSLTWISSIYTKKCDHTYLGTNNSKVQMDLTNYFTMLYPMDVIENSPVVRYDSNMDPDDYKHQLTIQLQDVTNAYDNSKGVLTWTNTWLGLTASHFSSPLWGFDCPPQGMYASYTPYAGYLRNVYVYDHFVNIY